ncbi:embryogenesis-like protein [Fagus crenata]|uniref:Uncharacterized protein n=1 Tax=Fagus sylvatica TaxID=28930 RepID=A0A2N9IMN0_FAGSY
MYRPSQSHVSLCKLFARLRHPFHPSPIPTSSSSLNSLPTLPTPLFSNSVPFPKPTSNFSGRRKYTTSEPGESVSESDQNKVVDMINLKFAEAREEIEMAMESKETVYFDEEAECARVAVKEVLDMFEGLLAKLSETQRAALQRSMGLKIEQLKAELQQLNE